MLTLVLALALASGSPGPDSPACRSLCTAAWTTLQECQFLFRPETCDRFLAAAERLSGRVECASPGYVICARDVAGEVSRSASSFLDSYFNALDRLSSPVPPLRPSERRRALRALAVLGSRASEATLDADWGGTWRATVRNARALSREGVLDAGELWRKWLADAPPRTARASSTLPGRGRRRHDAALAVDGHEATAWCAAKDDPADAWIEVTVSRPADAPRYAAFAIVPGYGRDEETFRRNNRILRLRVSECAHPAEGAVVDLTDVPPDEPRPNDVPLAPQVVRAPAGFRDGTTDCVRFTVLGVRRGRDGDTCLSEIAPIRDRAGTPGEVGRPAGQPRRAPLRPLRDLTPRPPPARGRGAGTRPPRRARRPRG